MLAVSLLRAFSTLPLKNLRNRKSSTRSAMDDYTTLVANKVHRTITDIYWNNRPRFNYTFEFTKLFFQFFITQFLIRHAEETRAEGTTARLLITRKRL